MCAVSTCCAVGAAFGPEGADKEEKLEAEGEEGVVVVPLDTSTEEQTEIAIRELNNLLPEPLELAAKD